MTRSKKIIDKCLNCFTGEDGGIGFVNLKSLLEEMERQSNAGDEPAEQIIVQAERFVRLIDVAKNM